MSTSAFVVPWDKINPVLVSLHTFIKKNPDWDITIFYDDVLTKQKIESSFTRTFTFVELEDASPVLALQYLVNNTTHTRVGMISPNTVCNRPLIGFDTASIDDVDLVIRPDRVFELTKLNNWYVDSDPAHLDRFTRSRSYFTCGVTIYNLERIRTNYDTTNLYANYISVDCLDRGYYKHYLNRFFDGAPKGLMPSDIGVKPEPNVVQFMPAAMCMRHHVRLMHGAVVNYSGPMFPWSKNPKIDKLFLQIPFREYYNYAFAMKDHVSPAWLEEIRKNATRWLDRFGDYDKTFEKAYSIEKV